MRSGTPTERVMGEATAMIYRTRMLGLTALSVLLLLALAIGASFADDGGVVSRTSAHRTTIGVGGTIPGYLELVEQAPGSSDIALLVRANTPWTLIATLNAVPGATARIRQAGSNESWTTLQAGSSVQVPCHCFHFAGDNPVSFDCEPVSASAAGATVQFSLQPQGGDASRLWQATRTATGRVAAVAVSSQFVATPNSGVTQAVSAGAPATRWAPLVATVSVLPD